jgi:DNA-binding XRE family transcriptional regulator
MLEPKNVQTLLKGKRKEQKLTQVAAAKKASITRRVYQRVESGNGTISETSSVCEMLGMKVIIVSKDLI